VLEDEVRLDAGDLGAAREGVHGQVAQVVGVADPNVHEEVVLPGHVVDPDRLPEGKGVLPEAPDLLAGVTSQTHEDEGLDGDAEGPGFDLRPEAGEYSAFPEAADSLEAAGGGQADLGGQLLVRQPSILLESRQDGEVDSVQASPHGSSPQ